MNLFYRESGRGEAVVVLHGLYGCSDNWMSFAKKISEKYRVIAIDLRNHGASPHFSSHTYPDMVSDIASFFDRMNIGKAHIIGHSMGGKVAMAYAADFPERIVSLAVADIAPKNYMEHPESTNQFKIHSAILDILLSVDLSKFYSRKAIESEIGKMISDPFVVSFIMKNLKRENSGFEWKINISVLKKYLPQIVGGVDYSLFEERLPIFNYPVLFIKGGLSNYIQEEDLPLIKRIYPDAQFEVIEGTTHYLHAEKPDEFIGCYCRFISSK
jgi:esterase